MALTKLKKVLMEEDIRQNDLCALSSDIELENDPPRPGVNEATLSQICSGESKNPTKTTMDKILKAINFKISQQGKKKVYEIGDIF